MSDAEGDGVPQSPVQVTNELWQPVSPGGSTQGTTSPVYPATPSIEETANALRRTLSVKGLSSLDAKAVTERLWRGKNYAERRPRDLDALIAWTVRGGLRSFLLAYTFRAGFNLIFAIFSSFRKKNGFLKRLKTIILSTLRGETSIRFGAMFGLFTALYRWTFHGLRLYNPGPRGKGKEERWHAPLAGAVAGLAILAERPESRTAVAQQVFIRSVQGVVHRGHRRGLKIPHGDVLLFGLSCGTIMYSWILAPNMLDRGYNSWITKASRQHPHLVPIQRARQWNEPFPDDQAQAILDLMAITPHNRSIGEQAISKALIGNDGPRFCPCALHHPGTNSCIVHEINTWTSVVRWIMPVYLALHTIPPLVLRRKMTLRDPQRFLLRSIIGTLKSSAFLGFFVAIFQSLICFQRHAFTWLEELGFKRLARISAHRWWSWVFGFSTCLSLFVEDKRRREELALYVTPKAMESGWAYLKAGGLVGPIPFGGELWLNVLGVSLMMDTWRHEREALSGLVRNVLWQSVGP